jgi:hypothetical protein
MSASSTPNPFSNIVNQALLQYTVAFQAGQTIPPSPADFQANLTQQLNAYNKNWPASADPMDQATLQAAVTAYGVIYGAILSMPLPSNPTPEYQGWYEGTH